MERNSNSDTINKNLKDQPQEDTGVTAAEIENEGGWEGQSTQNLIEPNLTVEGVDGGDHEGADAESHDPDEGDSLHHSGYERKDFTNIAEKLIFDSLSDLNPVFKREKNSGGGNPPALGFNFNKSHKINLVFEAPLFEAYEIQEIPLTDGQQNPLMSKHEFESELNNSILEVNKTSIMAKRAARLGRFSEFYLKNNKIMKLISQSLLLQAQEEQERQEIETQFENSLLALRSENTKFLRTLLYLELQNFIAGEPWTAGGFDLNNLQNVSGGLAVVNQSLDDPKKFTTSKISLVLYRVVSHSQGPSEGTSEVAPSTGGSSSP